MNVYFILAFSLYSYPSPEQLEVVYNQFLTSVIQHQLPGHSMWGAARSSLALASSMVGLYSKLKERFTVDHHAHYIFTPRDLTAWTLALLRHDLTADDSKEHVLQVHERSKLLGILQNQNIVTAAEHTWSSCSPIL